MNRNSICIILYGLLCLLIDVQAQTQQRPEPGTAIVPIPGDDDAELPESTYLFAEEDIDSACFVRVWNFIEKDGGVAVGLISGGKDNVALASGCNRGFFGNYRKVAAGTYRILVAQNLSVNDEGNFEPSSIERDYGNFDGDRKIEIRPGTFNTIIAFGGDPMELRVVVDPQGSTVSGLLLRAYSFLPAGTSLAQVSAEDRITPKVLGPLESKPTDGRVSAGTNLLRIQGTVQTEEGSTLLLNSEANFRGVFGCSVVIFLDRYARPSMTSTRDATSRLQTP